MGSLFFYRICRYLCYWQVRFCFVIICVEAVLLFKLREFCIPFYLYVTFFCLQRQMKVTQRRTPPPLKRWTKLWKVSDHCSNVATSRNSECYRLAMRCTFVVDASSQLPHCYCRWCPDNLVGVTSSA